MQYLENLKLVVSLNMDFGVERCGQDLHLLIRTVQ